MISSEVFREGMSRLTGAVSIIATDGPAGKGGFTATAVSSVSDNPPTILVCLNQSNELTKVFEKNGVFSLNVVAGHHQQLANRFAGYDKVSMQERFDLGEWKYADQLGIPFMTDALAVFCCKISAWQPVATHIVIFGQVQEVFLPTANVLQPLLYFQRQYHTTQKFAFDK